VFHASHSLAKRKLHRSASRGVQSTPCGIVRLSPIHTFFFFLLLIPPRALDGHDGDDPSDYRQTDPVTGNRPSESRFWLAQRVSLAVPLSLSLSHARSSWTAARDLTSQPPSPDRSGIRNSSAGGLTTRRFGTPLVCRVLGIFRRTESSPPSPPLAVAETGKRAPCRLVLHPIPTSCPPRSVEPPCTTPPYIHTHTASLRHHHHHPNFTDSAASIETVRDGHNIRQFAPQNQRASIAQRVGRPRLQSTTNR
jgi:hypothetical protein